jgi:UDP-2,3-diacylglucosamine pyrophosphatase LpxH
VNFYRTAWISDVHLGTKGANAGALLEFLRDNEFDTLYIVGDLIDIWSLRRGIYWPQQHNDVIQKILRKARKGTRVIYIPGNHDEFLTSHLGAYGAVTIQKHAFHVTANGRRLLIMHGHELDTVVQNIRWLALAGDLGYQFLLALNPLVNACRRLCGFGYWSLSKYVKQRVKDAVSFIGAYEEAIVRYAEKFSVSVAAISPLHGPPELPAIEIIDRPVGDSLVDLLQFCIRVLLPIRKRGRETAELQGEQSLGAREAILPPPAMRNHAELMRRCEPHFGVADVRDEPADVAQRSIFPLENLVPELVCDQAQRGAHLFQMLARFMSGGAVRLAARAQRSLDLLAANSPNPIGQSLIAPQSIAHGHFCNVGSVTGISLQ